MTYPLAEKTTEIISSNNSENFGLLYYRLQKIQIKDKKNSDKKPFEVLQTLVNRSKTIYENRENQQIIKAVETRFDDLLNFAKEQDSECLNFSLKVDWRLVIGLGNPSVFDTGLRLHSIYGFPYLPGQGLKGAIRRVWMLETAENLGIPRLEAAEIKKLKDAKKKTPWAKFENLLMTVTDPGLQQNENEKRRVKKEIFEVTKLGYGEFWNKYAFFYQTVFGGANGQGKVDFLDVYPTELIIGGESILEVDIINAHYGEYYTSEGKTPPADYLSPNPVFFLCVRANTPFKFRVIMKGEAKKKKAEIEELIKKTGNDYGFGAKTMSGYGEMY